MLTRVFACKFSRKGAVRKYYAKPAVTNSRLFYADLWLNLPLRYPSY